MATVVIQKYQGKNKTSYAIRYKDPLTGKLKYYKTLSKKKDARNAANELRSIIDSGNLHELSKKSRKSRLLTFSEVAEDMIGEWKEKLNNSDLSEITYEGYLLRANILKDLYGKMLFREIDKDWVLEFQREIKDKSSNINSNRYLFIFKQIAAKAVELGTIFENPSESVKYLSEKSSERNKFLLPDKIDKLIEASQKTRAKYYLPALIYLGAEHGTSKQEALSLKWDDVNFDFGDLGIIEFFRTKNSTQRTEYLMPRSRESLLNWKSHLEWMRRRKKINAKDTKFVFCRLDGTPIKRFDTVWRTICKIAEIDDFHYHDLRHTFCSNLILSGSNLKDVKEMIGHSDLAMTDRYSHLTLLHKRNRQVELEKHYSAK